MGTEIVAGVDLGLCSTVAPTFKSRLWVRAAKSAVPQSLPQGGWTRRSLADLCQVGSDVNQD